MSSQGERSEVLYFLLAVKKKISQFGYGIDDKEDVDLVVIT